MRKRYFFLMMLLFPIATMFTVGNAYAEDPPKEEYDAAMEAIEDGAYYLTTDIGETKYYVCSDGSMTSFENEACLFAVSKVSGGALYDVGILLDPGTGSHFSNTTLIDNVADLNPGTGVFRLDGSNDRNDWERQVFFMDAEGKYAIRSCNTAYGTESWADAGRAFWTYEIDETDPEAEPMPCYSYDPAYIWSLEKPALWTQVYNALESIYIDYEEYVWDTGEGETLNMGTGFGQHRDFDTWNKFFAFLQDLSEIESKYSDEAYDYYSDPDALTLEQIEAMRAEADSLFQVILDSEQPYTIPKDGYYRIIANLRYQSTASESGYVTKALLASFDPEHENKGMYGTYRTDRANYLWKLTQDGDSIVMQNAGMETFVSFTSPAEGRVILTKEENDRSEIVFDWAGEEEVQLENGRNEVKDIFYIRLASQARRAGNYVHQLGHNRGTDSGVDMELSFWNGTYNMGDPYDSDKGTSEWYLEYVPDDEAQKLISGSSTDIEHDLLVQKTNTLREQVLQAITETKDPIKTALITEASQFSSPYSQNDLGGARDGGDLSAGVLIDGDKSTFWHSVWSGNDPGGYHYLQIADVEAMVGDCELYVCRRTADNDHPTQFQMVGSNDSELPDEEWEDMLLLSVPNGTSGAEAFVRFHVDTPHKYIRLVAIDCTGANYGFRTYWHAAELQISTLAENPNSRFNAMGELGPALVDAYNANMAIADDDLTEEAYQALLEAYNAFYGPIENHNELVEMNKALREEVKTAIEEAKDPIINNLITSVEQMSSPYGYNEITGNTDGGNLADGVLIDGDKSTYWHSVYGDACPQEPHYVQLSDMENMEGYCEFYICDRNTTSGNWPSEITLLGSEDPEAAYEDWETIAVFKVQAGDAVETTVPFNAEKSYPYVRIVATNCSPNYQYFWHAAEIQIRTVRENPNSQFIGLGEIATNLEAIYNANLAVEDNDITFDMYTQLLNAYNAFQAGLVDPTELRDALAAYADVARGAIQGTEPGQWANTDVATAFDNLYKEADAYDKAGKYKAAQSHKYAVMLKSMSKSVMEQANGIKTGTWYRFMFPTEEMYDAYGFDKSGGSPASNYEEQPYQWGSYVVAGEMIYDDGETLIDVEALDAEDIREGTAMFFMDDELIDDKDASMFRFVAKESDDYSSVFSEVKGNMTMALDMSSTVKKGEALITDASQFSSNASYPGTDGQKLETGCLIDGDKTTYWHSDYSKTYCVVPYLQVALNQPVSGLIQVDMTRRQNIGNGHPTRMFIQGSNDGENWTNIGYLETPYTKQNESVTSQPVDLGGSYSYLRFTMTNRAGTDGGSNIEFDPFAENLTADDYNTKFTYFHAAEFQIYPVTVEQSASAKTLQQAYTTANKVVLKDATADDFNAASQAYKAYQSEFNAAEGKAVLPNGADKPVPTYAIQNKATGLFVNAKAANNNDVLFQLVPTFFDYKAIGFDRNLMHGRNIDGTDVTYLHSQNWNHRFVTWNSTAVNSNSGLVIREAGAVEPAEFSFYKDIKLGEIYNWCNSVSITNEGDGVAYSAVGRYTTEAGVFLALKAIETIPAGEPALYICGELSDYDAEADDADPMKFTMPAEPELAIEGKTVNGLIGNLVNHTLKEHEIYFDGNKAECIGQTGYYISGNSAVLDIFSCPEIDPSASFDFSILLGEAAQDALGVEALPAAIEKISKPGDVYSMDGKLLRKGATLNSLKSLGRGMYILNGVKVLVK